MQTFDADIPSFTVIHREHTCRRCNYIISVNKEILLINRCNIIQDNQLNYWSPSDSQYAVSFILEKRSSTVTPRYERQFLVDSNGTISVL
jgi:hypothetical protein